MAEYCKLPTKALNYRVPKSIPAAHAAYVEPLACAIHAVERGNIQLNDTVVIAGAGPLGLGMVAAARMKNPALLIALDLDDRRLEIARACGANLGLNPNSVDVIDEVHKLTEGYGCDVYIEGNRASRGSGTGTAYDLQTRHICRVQCDARTRDNGLDDYWRYKRTQYSRRAFESALLSHCHSNVGTGASPNGPDRNPSIAP